MSSDKSVNVFLSKEMFNSLIAVLTIFISVGEKNQYGIYSERLKNKMLKYSRKFIHNNDEQVSIHFYENEIAMLIKIFSIYANVTEKIETDYFSEIGKT